MRISCESCGFIGEPTPAGRCRNCSTQLVAPAASTPDPDVPELPEDADLPTAELGLTHILILAGEDPERFPDTPRRAVQALLSLTAGNEQDPAEIMGQAPFCAPGAGRATLCADVRFRTACQDCMLPVLGEARLRCKPGGRDLDAGHLARLTGCLSRRLQTEPQLAEQLAAALVDLGGAESASAKVSFRRPCDECGSGESVTTARVRRTAPAGGDSR